MNLKNRKLCDNFSYNINSTGFGLHYYVGTKGTTYIYYHYVWKWEYYTIQIKNIID